MVLLLATLASPRALQGDEWLFVTQPCITFMFSFDLFTPSYTKFCNILGLFTFVISYNLPVFLLPWAL